MLKTDAILSVCGSRQIKVPTLYLNVKLEDRDFFQKLTSCMYGAQNSSKKEILLPIV